MSNPAGPAGLESTCYQIHTGCELRTSIIPCQMYIRIEYVVYQIDSGRILFTTSRISYQLNIEQLMIMKVIVLCSSPWLKSMSNLIVNSLGFVFRLLYISFFRSCIFIYYLLLLQTLIVDQKRFALTHWSTINKSILLSYSTPPLIIQVLSHNIGSKDKSLG
jgi:hypothetical protein